MKSLILSLVVFSLSLNTFAAQSLSTKISSQYSSIRALGMGNAFTAVADDYSLIFYNPAGFARKPYNEFQITLAGAGVSAKTLTIVDDIKKASDTPGTDNDKAQAVSDALEKYYGESLGGKLQALEIFWVRKGWGLALIPLDLTIDMSVNRQLGPALDLNVKGDTSFAFGYGTSVNKSLDVGVTGKFLHRVAVEQSVSAIELAADPNVLNEDRFKEGVKVDFDLGFMYTPDWFANKSAKVTEAAAPAPAPEATDIKKEEIKPQESTDAKATDAKPEDADKPAQAVDGAKPEEQRTPQAEGDPVVAQTSADDKNTEKAETTEGKKEDTASADANAPVVPTADAAAKPTEAPTAEPAGVVKLGEAKPEEQKNSNDLNAGAGYPLTFGLVVKNVIGGEFTKSTAVNKNATEVPTKIERTIDIGSQYRFYDGEDLKIRAMLDFQNLLHPNITLATSTHMGAEFDYSPSGWFKTQFRVGMNQMYYTAGATFLFGVLNIDLATYGEEVGTESNKIQNRVMAAKLGLNF